MKKRHITLLYYYNRKELEKISDITVEHLMKSSSLFQVNFVVTQFTALILAGLLRTSLSPIATTPAARHVYGLTIGLALGYFCFGR